MKVLVTQLCPTLCDPMNCSPPRSSIHGILRARILELGSHFFLQGVFLTQGLNPGLLHCRQILYHLTHQGSPSSFFNSIFLENYGTREAQFRFSEPPPTKKKLKNLNCSSEIKLLPYSFIPGCSCLTTFPQLASQQG
ncbi:unnamed protein product [Rangifer tarandus platyrhynchus]|uniref:Uncharacterized protein n=1 Tax=Rangifer tarandus platyrhynchus TaxID=3082113 RepID=A0AC59Y159_RANTA